MKYKYRIIFYLNPEVKDRLEYLNIEYTNKKIEVRKSPIQGYGVFAKEEIKAGEILEECHYIKIKSIQCCN